MTDLELRDELTRLLLMVALKRSGGTMEVTETELMSVAGHNLRVGHNPGATMMHAELVPPGDSTETGGGG